MIARVYTGPDGRSHFGEMILPPPGVDITELAAAKGVLFRRFPPGLFMDFHCAPRRQYLITLAGMMEVGLGDGTRRRFGPGDALLAEDLTGQGHTSRVIGSEPRVAAIIHLG